MPVSEAQIEALLPHLRIIAKGMARRTAGRMEYDDLVQIGFLGLVQAAKNFDASRGFGFKTFAEWRMRGAMLDAIRVQTQNRSGLKQQIAEPLRLDHAKNRYGRPLWEDLADPRPAVLEELLTDEPRQQLQEAIRRLPKPERDVLTLLCQNQGYRDIATSLGISVPTVFWHRKQAVKRIRKILEADKAA